MKNAEKAISDFFDAYERRFNDTLNGGVTDVDAIAGSFADYFVESSPVGVQGGKNDQQFRAQIPKGYDFYKSIGTKSMKAQTRAVTILDELHFMVRVHWLSLYEKKGHADIDIEFDVFYLLTFASGEPKIFAYVTGDETKVLQEHNLVPRQKSK